MRGWHLLWFGVMTAAISSALAQASGSPLPASSIPTRPDSFFAEGRFSIPQPQAPWHVAESARLFLDLKDPAVVRIFVTQRAVTKEYSDALDERETPLQKAKDGRPFVAVTPLAFGKLMFVLRADFADGGIAFGSITVVAGPATVAPEKLETKPGIFLQLEANERKGSVWVQARFKGVDKPIMVPASYLHFTVQMTRGDPPIHFDAATGNFDALRAGKALIETRYSGLVARTCVVVSNSLQYFNGAECKDLSIDSPADVGRAPRAAFMADERIDIPSPDHALKLAEQNEVKLVVHGPEIAKVASFQLRNTTLLGSFKDLPVENHADGRVSVNFFPMELGRIEFDLTITFVDGGIAQKKVKVDVELGAKRPTQVSFWGSLEGPLMPVILDWTDALHSQAYSAPSVLYQGLVKPVVIPGNLAKYTLKTEGEQPAVQLDPANGTVTALRFGQALVQTEYAGFQVETCYVVTPWNMPYTRDLSNCRSLRADHAAALPDIEISPDSLSSPLGRSKGMAAATISRRSRDRFDANARFAVPLDAVSLQLGQPSQLVFQLDGPPLLQFYVTQTVEVRNFEGELTPMDKTAEVWPKHLADGTTYIDLTALQTHKAQIRFFLLFVDGGVATRTMELPVTVPSTKPIALMNKVENSNNADTAGAPVLHLAVSGNMRKRQLFPQAYYSKTGPAVYLQPSDVVFAVKTVSEQPIIDLDKSTGIATALRPGHALIRTSFAGATTDTCVVVTADTSKGDNSSCEELQK